LAGARIRQAGVTKAEGRGNSPQFRITGRQGRFHRESLCEDSPYVYPSFSKNEFLK